MPVTRVEIDLSLYEPQLRILQSDPNTRIVGSIGRMVACQEVMGDPFLEFHARSDLGIGTDRTSDIDVLGTSSEVLARAREQGDMVVDDQAFNDTDVAIRNDGGNWYLKSADVDFEERISSDLMKPVFGNIMGIEIVTVPLLAHEMLHSIRQTDARKDLLTRSTIGRLIHNTALKSWDIPKAPQAWQAPFFKLQTRLRLKGLNASERHSTDEEDDNRHSH